MPASTGLYFNEDPVAITQGRMPDPHKADEFVLDAATAQGIRAITWGRRSRSGGLTNAQADSGNLAPNSTFPADQRARVKLVGIGSGAGDQRCSRTRTRHKASPIMLFTPAFTDKLLACCSNDMVSALTLQGGNPYLAAVEAEIRRVLPKGLPFIYVQVEDRVAIANDTLRPEAIALAVFGGIAGLPPSSLRGR